MIRALILAGDGINCETETAFACRQAGFQVDISSISKLIERGMGQAELKKQYRLLVLPGGFSFGDDLGSGRVFALKIKKGLDWNLNQFTQQGGLVLGICNGFQALLRMGVFGKDITITKNSNGQFMDRWVDLEKESQNPSPWLKGYSKLMLPIRHGEGRVLFNPDQKKSFSIALKYSADVNGSQEKIAGLTTLDGRILGLMPHPEAFVRQTQHPYWTQHPEKSTEPGQGNLLFKNAYEELSKNGT